MLNSKTDAFEDIKGIFMLFTQFGVPKRHPAIKQKGGLCCEGKIISKAYLREMQSNQEKGKHQNYL